MKKLDKTISEVWEDKYVVPLYQRNFAWTEKEINLLLQDVYDSFKKAPDSNYYIGSLVVLRRQDGTLEVIDGQQRLTVLHMLCRVLKLINSPCLTYDSRPEVERFFDELFSIGESIDVSAKDKSKIYRLIDGLEAIRYTHLHTAPGRPEDKEFVLCKQPDDKKQSTLCMADDEKQKFTQYLAEKVILVRVELPSDTDVAAYFEIMNNRGEQLQEHEIIKAKLMAGLSKEERSVFSTVWEACSQMNIPIQRALKSYRQNQTYPLFGANYEELHLEFLPTYLEADGQRDFQDIDSILKESYVEEENEDDGVEERLESIVDFPNFLMLLFKSYDPETELNDKYLLSRFESIQSGISPMSFINKLLSWRVRFDKYVLKSVGDEEDEDNQRWTLQRPYLYINKNSPQLKFKNTFNADNDYEPSDYEILTTAQSNVIMAESMLQVTFRNKKYKNWLFDLLQWMEDVYGDGIDISGSSLMRFFHEWMIKYYSENIAEKENIFALGTDTPYFVFNFVDYLYWFENRKGKDAWNNNIPYLDSVKDFRFKYYNSVEHHLPQSYEESREVLDSIGNLCLISKSKNSSLKDKGPTEKAKIVEGLSPKRMIMYVMTNLNNCWDKKSITEHGQDVIDLLSKARVILGI